MFRAQLQPAKVPDLPLAQLVLMRALRLATLGVCNANKECFSVFDDMRTCHKHVQHNICKRR